MAEFKQSINVQLMMNGLAHRLAYVAFPKLLFELMQAYFRVEVEGLEHLPRRGKLLIAPNHSGCSGLDAVVLGFLLNKELRRVPRILALWNVFRLFPSLEQVAKKMGLKQASSENGVKLLKKNHLTIIFPEGEKGSFKPSSERYKLRPFHTGFIRMALLSGAPIIPCVIIGAEESNINLGVIEFEKFLKGLVMPVPFNLIPFPAKWKIQFYPPVDLSEYTPEDANDILKMQAAARKVRDFMQNIINRELNQRRYVYFHGGGLINRQLLLMRNGL